MRPSGNYFDRISMKFNITKSVFPALLSGIIFVGCNKSTVSKENIQVKGSDTELKLVKSLAAHFESVNPETNVFVSGGGTGSGIDAFIHGKATVANASRKMTDDEYAIALKNGIHPVPVIIATDAIAFIVNPKIGVDSLSVFQVRDLLNGKITNWKEVGGKDRQVHIYGRTTSSGTREFIRQTFLKQDFSSGVKELIGSDAIIHAVITDEGGFGYVGVGTLMDKNGKPTGKVWATYLYLENNRAISPYELKAVESGEYPLTRPLLQYFNHWPQGVMLDFLNFELSEEGQQIIRENGYFPISDYHRQLNKLSQKESN